MAIVLLLRHGHSTANEQGILAGWTPGVGLTEQGRRQASDVARRLSSVTLARAVASPLQRCAETAALALAGADTTPETDDRLGECHYGAWTGLHLAEAAKDDLWRVVQDDPAAATFPPHDVFRAESLLTMAQRVVGAGLAGLQRVRVDPGSLSVVQITPTRMVLLASNTTQGDLAPLVSVPRHTPAGDGAVGGGDGGSRPEDPEQNGQHGT